MARLKRSEVFSADEIAIVHVMARVVRRCMLMGYDSVTGKNYDHRKRWIEGELKRLSACFGIDLLVFAIMSNHLHLILRSRPDVVQSWDNKEVALRWLQLCPVRKRRSKKRQQQEQLVGVQQPSEAELNTILNNAKRLEEIRSRLSDISWWMRLICQRIAQWANAEEEEQGKFWQSRFKAVRLLDEESLLACAAYVDLNPIRAAMAETLEQSHHTSVQRRIEALKAAVGAAALAAEPQAAGALGKGPAAAESRPDAWFSPVELDPQPGALAASGSRARCSDKGFLPMSSTEYLELLDWTARQVAPGKRGATPESAPPIFERLDLKPAVWSELVADFGKLFSVVAGLPQRVDATRSRQSGSRYHLPRGARQLLRTAVEQGSAAPSTTPPSEAAPA